MEEFKQIKNFGDHVSEGKIHFEFDKRENLFAAVGSLVRNDSLILTRSVKLLVGNPKLNLECGTVFDDPNLELERSDDETVVLVCTDRSDVKDSFQFIYTIE